MTQWFVPVLLTILCWGVGMFLPKLLTDSIAPQEGMIHQVVGGVIIAVFLLLYSFNYQAITNININFNLTKNGIWIGIICGILNFLGILFYLKALSKGPVSIISSISALYPMITIALAFFLLQESMTWKQSMGLVFGIVAIVLLSV